MSYSMVVPSYPSLPQLLVQQIESATSEIDCIEKMEPYLEKVKDLQHLSTTSIVFNAALENESPVTVAAKKVYWEAVKILIKADKNFSSKIVDKDSRGYAPIHYACYLGMTDKINQMLEAGVDINLKSLNGSTPLLEAIRGTYL